MGNGEVPLLRHKANGGTKKAPPPFANEKGRGAWAGRQQVAGDFAHSSCGSDLRAAYDPGPGEAIFVEARCGAESRWFGFAGFWIASLKR